LVINLVSISGEPVQVSGEIITVSVSGQPVTISGDHVFVESGVYLASGIFVVADIAESGMGVQVQSGLSVIVQSGVYVSSGLMVDSGTLASESAVTLLRRIVKLLEPIGTQDQYQRQKILVDSMSGAVLSTVAAVTTVTNVGAAGIYGNNPVLATSASGGAFVSAYWHGVWTGPVENRWFMMDQSRATYAAQIRKNIWVV
jgi:hypothetical protein